MTKEKKSKSQNEDISQIYNIKLYDDEHCLRLYREEDEGYNKYISNKLNSKLKAISDDDDIDINESKLKKSIIKNLEIEDYEAIYKKTTDYIKANIYHGYDSKFYVLNKNSNGHILPLEYNVTDFNSTFQKYFGDNIKLWFEKYYRKYVLSIDNTKPRTYKLDSTNYLNLFSGYKYSKDDPINKERIKRGSAGVAFIWGHIKDMWNSGNEQCFDYDQKWIRKLIMGHKLKTMLYLKGKMGRGKSTIVKFIMRVLGKHNTISMSSDSAITGEYNGSLCAMVLCCLDEIVNDFNVFKSLYNKLKPYITENEIAYRNLYSKLKEMPNLTSFIMTGNYDMLKLDDPSKGEDRRIKVNDVSDELKDKDYVDKLDAYLDDPDVEYAFFWDCIQNGDASFNEGKELKLLPITESKKHMIAQSLDTCLVFLKGCINDKNIMNCDIKPKDLYNYYCEYYKCSSDGKKQLFNRESFLTKLKDNKTFIEFKNNVRKDGSNPTNYIYIDREKMIKLFTEKHYFNEYDDVYDTIEEQDDEDDEEDKGLYKQNQKLYKENLELQAKLRLLEEEINKLKAQQQSPPKEEIKVESESESDEEDEEEEEADDEEDDEATAKQSMTALKKKLQEIL